VNPFWQLHVVLVSFLFAVGAVVGSFLNVCIYRIPFQKSVIWPGSRCPRCFAAIGARDNVPIVSWLVLRGACRSCGAAIASRYMLIEALVGFLFAATYLMEICARPNALAGAPSLTDWVALFYHLSLVALLVTASFIDYDLTIIPDQVTVPGMLIGLMVGTLVPDVRPEPATAQAYTGGLAVGVLGLLVGGGLTQAVRLIGSRALGREAMGFGDVTLMAMIGSYVGWQVAVLTFFVAPFFGLGHALWKLMVYFGKRLQGLPASSADREIPFGPYLSMAAIALLISWPWLWPAWARNFFLTLRMLLLS
jgi:leader peptidase (prepilin peptidase)/N-methyltransferase